MSELFGAHVAKRGGGGGEGRGTRAGASRMGSSTALGPSVCEGRYSLHLWDTFQC